MANAIINVGQTGGQVNISTATAPATPAVGVVTLYAGTDKALHVKNSDGTDITIAAAGAASPITVEQTDSLVSTAVGATATAAGSVVIGATACAVGVKSVVIGRTACSTQPRAISIGSNSSACSDGTIAIGNQARVCQNPYEHGAIAIGSCAQANGIFSTVIGFRACTITGHDQVVVGRAACANDTSTAIGDSAKATGCVAISIGYNTTVSANGAITIGGSSSASHTNAVVLGAGLSSERANTTHVDSLVAYGQAASKKHAIGNTGGTVTVNFNNSNIQTLSLTSSISTLTKSNPIDGAVYTFQITQAGTGSYTIAWGSDVKWPGGTPPTLSTAVGAVDYVTLVYTGTNYYGNANLNFS